MYKALFAAAAAVALAVVFVSDASANPRVKFSEDSNASVDDNNVLSGNEVQGPGGITTGDVNFESFNSDIEVITNKELQVAVTDISVAVTGGPGGIGSTGNPIKTVNFDCSAADGGTANCLGIDNHPTGGPGGGASIATGSISCSGCFNGSIGFYNNNNNTGIGNALVAETAFAVNASTGSASSGVPGSNVP
jgi:hypothetical protein